MVAGVGLSYRIVKCLSAGVNLKYASEKLSKDDSYNAFAADVLLTAKLDGFPMKKNSSSRSGLQLLMPCRLAAIHYASGQRAAMNYNC